MSPEFAIRYWEMQCQTQDSKIRSAWYNAKLTPVEVPRHLIRNEIKHKIKIIAKFRCGNNINARQY